LKVDPRASGPQVVQKGLKNSWGHDPLLLTFRAYGPLSGVTLIQQCFKSHWDLCCCKQTVYRVFSSFFARPMGSAV